MTTVLLLGGTSEAVALAQRIVCQFRWRVITSLAGRTRQAAISAGEHRVGGFSGSNGMREYIIQNAIDVIIDATHPFATTISAHAQSVSKTLELPYLRVHRPAWLQQEGDLWYSVTDLSNAAKQLPTTARRLFLACGRKDLACFAQTADKQFIVRLIEAPQQRLPLLNYELILARGPFTEAEEIALFKHYRIDLVVSKNSGGAASYGKIAAARTLQIPVLMLQRPTTVYEPAVDSVDQAMRWLSCLTQQ